MRNRFRAGLLLSALLLAPVSTAATAYSVPLEQAPVQGGEVGAVCIQSFPESLVCALTSLSADTGTAGK